MVFLVFFIYPLLLPQFHLHYFLNSLFYNCVSCVQLARTYVKEHGSCVMILTCVCVCVLINYVKKVFRISHICCHLTNIFMYKNTLLTTSSFFRKKRRYTFSGKHINIKCTLTHVQPISESNYTTYFTLMNTIFHFKKYGNNLRS